MYTPEERERVRRELIAAARADPRITAAALTGSAAVGREDRWSDIDLAFGLSEDSQISSALDDWTARMYEEHGAVHHMDVRSGTWLYRVFMLANSLQVDLAFAPQGDFAAKAPTFQLLFGTAPERPSTPPSAEQLIGWAWLYALHVRSALARRSCPVRGPSTLVPSGLITGHRCCRFRYCSRVISSDFGRLNRTQEVGGSPPSSTRR